MRPLSEVVAHPSTFDTWENYAGRRDFSGLLCVLTRNRDSHALDRSNFRVALRMLGGESDTVQIFRFGHWACGWWEAIAVAEDSPAEAIARGIAAKLKDYPVLSDEDFSELEYTEAAEYWNRAGLRERIELCREHRVSIFAARRDDLPETPNGELCAWES